MNLSITSVFLIITCFTGFNASPSSNRNSSRLELENDQRNPPNSRLHLQPQPSRKLETTPNYTATLAAKLQSVRLHEINSSDSGYIEAGIDDNGRVPPSLDSYSTKNKFWTAFVKKGDDNYNQTIKNATSLNTRGILDFGSKDGKQLKTILERKMLMVVDLTDEEMQQAFGLFDKDGSGTIQVSESPDLIKACGEDLTPFRASILFNLFDTDTSGALTFEEFKVTLNKQDDGLAEEVLKAFFRTVDEDVSGSLSRGEVKKFLRNASLMPGENSEEVAVDAVNNTFDLDGDFQIQYEEVVKVMKDSGTYFS